MTVTMKRALLLKEYELALYANDGFYYDFTLMYGIPDGEDFRSVLVDLENGDYDDDIDDMLDLYKRAREYYGKAGYYIDGKLIYDVQLALNAMPFEFPERIYKK